MQQVKHKKMKNLIKDQAEAKATILNPDNHIARYLTKSDIAFINKKTVVVFVSPDTYTKIYLTDGKQVLGITNLEGGTKSAPLRKLEKGGNIIVEIWNEYLLTGESDNSEINDTQEVEESLEDYIAFKIYPKEAVDAGVVKQQVIRNESNMKVTVKKYNEQVEYRSKLKSLEHTARREEDWNMVNDCEVSIKLIDEQFFDKLPTVFVSYWIGSRAYYREAVKIGKSYFMHYQRMTKGRGYRNIKEIPEITDKMQADMLADSYYY